jgi:signal transduction histidine kinase/PAS domain-containing protein
MIVYKSYTRYAITLLTGFITAAISYNLYQRIPAFIFFSFFILVVIVNVIISGWKAGVVSTFLQAIILTFILVYLHVLPTTITIFVVSFLIQGTAISLIRKQTIISKSDDEFYASLFTHMPEAVMVTDSNHVIIYWNHLAEKMFGIKAMKAKGRTPFDVTGLHLEANGEHVYTVKDGNQIYLETSTSLLKGLQKAHKSYVTLIHNTTEKNAIIQSKDYILNQGLSITSTANYSHTIKSIMNAVIPRLADGCMLFIAEDATHLRPLASYHRDPHIDSILQHFHSIHLSDSTHLEKWEQIMIRNTPTLISNDTTITISALSSTNTQLRVLQEIHPKQLIIVPLHKEEHFVGCIILLKSSDSASFTNMQQDEAQLLAEYIAHALHNARILFNMQEEVRLREEHLSIASHELRTPLTALLLQLQSVLKSIYNDPLAKLSIERLLNLLKNAQDQSNRLSNLIDSLLDRSRMIPGKLQLVPEHVDLSSMLKKIVDGYGEQVRRDGVELSLYTDGEIYGTWDPVKIEQVIANLVGNALKYGAKKPVEVSGRKIDDYALIQIKDQGIGIPQGKQVEIFKPFSRAVAKNEFEGLGLGLYIASQIIKAHKGEISVVSEEGKGSLFTIKLPLNLTN